MMIVVAIVAILTAIAVPNLSSFFINNRLDSASNEFLTALNLARSESIRRGTSVVMNRAAGSATQQWTLGWQMFIDANGNDTFDSGEEQIRIGQPISAPMTLYASRNTPYEITFAPDGRLSAGSNLRVFVLCYDNQIATASGQSRSRAVIVTETGRVQLAATNASGQPMKDPGGGQVPVTSCTSP